MTTCHVVDERVFFASGQRCTPIDASAAAALGLVEKWDGRTKSDAESATVVRPRFMALDMGDTIQELDGV